VSFDLRIEGAEHGFTPRVSQPLTNGGFNIQNAGQLEGRFEAHHQNMADIGRGSRDQDIKLA